MEYETRLFIGGQYVNATSTETLSVNNPNNDTLLCDKIQVASQADIDAAVNAAKNAFPAWRDMSGKARRGIMLKFADLLEANADKLAELEGACMGQPIIIAKLFVQIAVDYWRFYAGFAGNLPGESYPPDDDGTYKIVQYEPLGVCAGVCAWNGTHVLAAFKMAPALATGNTTIIKVSEKSPLSVATYGHLANQAGFPPGVLNIVSGAGSVGAMLAAHMHIDKISFTGSAFAGRAVMVAAAKSNLKRVALELGGKSPALIFDDADLANAVVHNSINVLLNSGQVCFAATRVLVQEGIAPKFIEAVKAAFEDAATKMGDASDPGTLFGPLADMKQFERVMSFLDDGRAEGLQFLTGGRRHGNSGAFVQPTIILNPDSDARVFTDEIFGPVITIKTFKTEEEAVNLANNTTYGLGSSIYTADVARALRVATKLQAGTVSVNASFSLKTQTPFGGYKQSGYGRESGLEGIKEYLQMKAIHINISTPVAT